MFNNLAFQFLYSSNAVYGFVYLNKNINSKPERSMGAKLIDAIMNSMEALPVSYRFQNPWRFL
jgi:hypothetical protein